MSKAEKGAYPFTPKGRPEMPSPDGRPSVDLSEAQQNVQPAQATQGVNVQVTNPGDYLGKLAEEDAALTKSTKLCQEQIVELQRQIDALKAAASTIEEKVLEIEAKKSSLEETVSKNEAVQARLREQAKKAIVLQEEYEKRVNDCQREYAEEIKKLFG